MASDQSVINASDTCAREGQTSVYSLFIINPFLLLCSLQLAEPEDELDYHYICFTKVKDMIYELDGMKAGPLPVMESTNDSFLQVLLMLSFTSLSFSFRLHFICHSLSFIFIPFHSFSFPFIPFLTFIVAGCGATHKERVYRQS